MYVDGEARGETPLSLDDLEEGSEYEIKVEKEGYTSKVERVTPSSEDSNSVSVALDRADGVFRISTYPTDAEIELNGEKVGYSPVTVTKLSRARTHELVARLEDRRLERTVEWKEGDEPVKELKLKFEEDDESDDEDDAAAERRAAARRAERRREKQRRERERERERARRARAARESNTGGGSNSGGGSSSGGGSESSSESSSNSGSSSGSSEESEEEVTETNLFSTASSESDDDSSGGGGGGTSDNSGTSSSGNESEEEEATDLDIWGEESSGDSASSSESESSGNSQSDDGNKGYLSVQVQKGWGKVYVDDEKVASETPLVNYALEPGPHTVKVYYPVLKRYSEKRIIQIDPGETTRTVFDP